MMVNLMEIHYRQVCVRMFDYRIRCKNVQELVEFYKWVAIILVLINRHIGGNFFGIMIDIDFGERLKLDF